MRDRRSTGSLPPARQAPRAGTAGDERAARAPWARRRGHLAARPRPRRLRTSTAQASSVSRRAISRCTTEPETGSPTTARSTTTSSCATSSGGMHFATDSDTEVILRAYRRWGQDCLDSSARHVRLRALGRSRANALRRPRPVRHQAALLHAVVDGVFYCASEAKALLPFLPSIETDPEALEGLPDVPVLRSAGKTLFEGVSELLPGHLLTVRERLAADASLLGRPLRARPRPHRGIPRRDGSGSWSRIRSTFTCAPTSRSARTSAAVSTRASSAPLARGAWLGFQAFTGRFAGGPALRRERVTRARSRQRGHSHARARHRPRRLHREHRAMSSTTSTIPVAGPGSFPSTCSPGWPART